MEEACSFCGGVGVKFDMVASFRMDREMQHVWGKYPPYKDNFCFAVVLSLCCGSSGVC